MAASLVVKLTAKMGRAIRSQLLAFLLAVLELKTEDLPKTARVDSLALLEKTLIQVIRIAASAVIKPLLLELDVSCKKKRAGLDQNFVDSWLPDTNVLVSAFQAQVRRALPVHSYLSRYGTEPGHFLDGRVRDQSEDRILTTVASQ